MSIQVVIRLLSNTPPIDVSSKLANGDSPLHTYVRKGSAGYPLLLALISHCDPDRLDLDVHGEKLNTPLHLASEVRLYQLLCHNYDYLKWIMNGWIMRKL